MTLTATPLTPAIGAELSGIDFSKPISPAVGDALYEALIAHKVVFMRGQDVAPAAHMALAEALGKVDAPHPVYPAVEGFPSMVCLDTSDNNPPDTDVWHADLTFRAQPPFASILRAVHLPPSGGDTIWADMYAAVERMDPHLRAECEGLRAVHDMGNFRNAFTEGADGSAEKLSQAMAKLGCAVRPIIDISPVTGKPFLNVNEGFTTYVCGLSRRASDRLLQRLFALVEHPEIQVRFRWSPGAIAIWDNRVTQHYAVADYMPERRIMHRVTVIEDTRASAQTPPDTLAEAAA